MRTELARGDIKGRMVRLLFLALSVVSSLSASGTANCGDVDLAALSNAVAQSVGAPRDSLFVTERIDLSARLVDLQFASKTAGLKRGQPSLPLPVRDVRVFEFSRQGHRIDAAGNLVAMAVDLDDAPLWRVAYDCRKGTLSHLAGFDDVVQGFNAVMTDLNLNVQESAVADEVQSVFVAFTDRNSGGVIQSRLGLMRAASKHYSGPDDVDRFLAYWRRLPKDVVKRIAPPTATRSGTTFAVNYVIAGDRGIETVALSIGSDGQIRLRERKTIYTWPSK